MRPRGSCLSQTLLRIFIREMFGPGAEPQTMLTNAALLLQGASNLDELHGRLSESVRGGLPV